jgi:signal transduction histidine kinase/DNA-binding response OmpR family regulator
MSTKATKKLSDSIDTSAHAVIPYPESVNILVVDDLPEKLLVYRSVLEELGQNLIMVSSGEEALKMVLKHEFAVILLDVNMPGMDGFETAALIRQRKKSARTPIIFLTAFTDDVYAAQGYASGAVDYLPTPVVPEILRAKVRVFIELHQMRRQATLQAEEQTKRTAAEESARRSAFLAKASELFTRSKQQADITRVLVEFPIPYLADACLLWFSGTENRPEEATLSWMDKDRIVRNKPVDSLAEFPWFIKAIRETSQNGLWQLLAKINPVFTLPEAEQGSLLKESGVEIAPGPVLIVPISMRGITCGAIAFMRLHPEGIYQSDDITLANDLASRAGIALENVILIDRIKEADRRKDEFLGMLAHELRNPLGPIRNAVQLLQIMDPTDSRVKELRDIIDRQVLHMVRMIDDLLDATRLAHGKILLRKESCDLAKLVRQTANDYHSIFDASGLKLSMHVPDTQIWMEGDATRLVQAVGNLLHNAHKFTNPGGEVKVHLEHDRKNREATITVEDNGIGLEPKMLNCVFDVFRQAEQGLARSQGGLGLGLALVKGLVELHGGKVTVESKGAGQGAKFIIRLPVQEISTSVSSPADTAIPEGKKYRILLIEDNQDMAESARLLLSMEGYDVRTAYSGTDGLQFARNFLPQVILCDIGLPGMDGYQVARTIRQDKALSSAYVIALTGYGRDEDQRQAQEAGFDMHMIKPIDYNTLRRALAHLPA